MNFQPKIEPRKPGELIKDELRERGLSQKDFAKAVGVVPSYLSEIIKGRRRLSLQFAQKVESLLGIPSRFLMDMQTASDIVAKSTDPSKVKEMEAAETLEKIDSCVCVKTLLKRLNVKFPNSLERLNALKSVFGLGNDLEAEIKIVTNGCFRKSNYTGLDERMITTWLFIAMAVSRQYPPIGKYNPSNLPALCKDVASLLHQNSNTLFQLESILSSAGIGLLRVDKVDHASIDGFSFFRDGIPFIAITCRYDRIDNLAFTVMHELGHLVLGHTTTAQSSLNIDMRSFDDESIDEKELEADAYAGGCLINPSLWKFAPRVSNPWTIQSTYEKWAKGLNLNPWIVLGRLSYETGMYKFKSDESRKINGGKEGCHELTI